MEQATQDQYIGQFLLRDEETLLTMIRRGGLLIAGGVTNCGLIEEYEFKVDECFSIDENMQTFIEEIEEKVINLELLETLEV
jgi:hypothetical protein|tara:strand:- start:1301 stop:1546 length:246 start_codon:yes stop_codon:yes gene_type:complete